MVVSISVIVPIYNRESCLRRCLDSIVQQSFEDWECILLDDGSTDATYDICKGYAMTDSRFQVYHQENQGVSVARNKGLERAVGAYINFVDSDDYLDRNCLQKLLDAAEGGSDLAIGGLRVFKDIKKQSHVYVYPTSTFSLGPNQEVEFIRLLGSFLLNGPCCKLFKQSIIQAKQIAFRKEISYGEDTIFNYEYLMYASNISIVSDSLYNIVETPDSLKFKWSNQSFEHHLLRWESLVRLCEVHRMCGEAITLYHKQVYAMIVWLGAAFVRFNHSTLSLSDRYAYLKTMLSTVDSSYLDGGINFSQRRLFLIKHRVLLWLLFELYYWMEKLRIVK